MFVIRLRTVLIAAAELFSLQVSDEGIACAASWAEHGLENFGDSL
jgi:hypothetical protein